MKVWSKDSDRVPNQLRRVIFVFFRALSCCAPSVLVACPSITRKRGGATSWRRTLHAPAAQTILFFLFFLLSFYLAGCVFLAFFLTVHPLSLDSRWSKLPLETIILFDGTSSQLFSYAQQWKHSLPASSASHGTGAWVI